MAGMSEGIIVRFSCNVENLGPEHVLEKRAYLDNDIYFSKLKKYTFQIERFFCIILSTLC